MIFFGLSSKDDDYAMISVIIFFVDLIVPLIAGYLTALRWKAKHPAIFFFQGLGMSLAFGCLWVGCIFGVCARV